MQTSQQRWNALIWIIVLVVILGLLIWWMLASNTENTNTNTVSNTNIATTNVNSATESTNTNATAVTNSTTPTEVDPATATGTVHEISMSNSGPSQPTLTITVGDTVTWTNNGSTIMYIAPNTHPEHNEYPGVWEDDGTGRITAGQSYSFTFNTQGTYGWHDHNHPDITGTIVVQ